MLNLNAKPRESAVAGSFYPNDKKKLVNEVEYYLKNAQTYKEKDVNAIIVPHAGYVFSAHTAATAYNSLTKNYKNIFLIGSSHHVHFEAASIYTQGNYKTPLGEVKLNQEIINSLMQHELFTYDKNAHTKEHTLEVQLPFLQTIYKDSLEVIPIIIGTYELQNIIEIAKVLKPYFDDKENLFIISTDLSHYPSYEDANKIDTQTLNAIIKNDPLEFIHTMSKNEDSAIKKLATSACGWSSLLTLLHMTKDEEYQYELLEYKNSGDTKYGDKDRVVGYGALRVYKDNDEFFLSSSEKNELLELAKLSLYEATLNNKKITINDNEVSSKLKRHLGAFVTLNKDHKLRGCIGRFEPQQPLYDVILDMAIASAKHDTRFSEVTKNELQDIDLEISVLTPRKRIYSLDEIEIGKHGIYIESGNKHGTYLPHVATQMNWNVKEFVESCAFDKAGLTPEEYLNANIYTYEAIVFDEQNIR